MLAQLVASLAVALTLVPNPAAVRPVPGALVRPFEAPATPYGPGHRGVDLAAEHGELVLAVLPGAVTFAGPVALVGWVSVDHGGGLRTTYGDLGTFLVTAGDRVQAGQPLGRLAEHASHLDWGARLDGEYIDPTTLLVRWRVRYALPEEVVYPAQHTRDP